MFKLWEKFSPTVDMDALVHRYQEAHDDLADDVFTARGAAMALEKENFEEDGMGNWICQINYRCRKDREPFIFKISQREYKALKK